MINGFDEAFHLVYLWK